MAGQGTLRELSEIGQSSRERMRRHELHREDLTNTEMKLLIRETRTIDISLVAYISSIKDTPELLKRQDTRNDLIIHCESREALQPHAIRGMTYLIKRRAAPISATP